MNRNAQCPQCQTVAPLSADRETGVEFDEPLCEPCRAEAIRELTMDAFDLAYERAIARGWSD